MRKRCSMIGVCGRGVEETQRFGMRQQIVLLHGSHLLVWIRHMGDEPQPADVTPLCDATEERCSAFADQRDHDRGERPGAGEALLWRRPRLRDSAGQRPVRQLQPGRRLDHARALPVGGARPRRGRRCARQRLPRGDALLLRRVVRQRRRRAGRRRAGRRRDRQGGGAGALGRLQRPLQRPGRLPVEGRRRAAADHPARDAT